MKAGKEGVHGNALLQSMTPRLLKYFSWSCFNAPMVENKQWIIFFLVSCQHSDKENSFGATKYYAIHCISEKNEIKKGNLSVGFPVGCWQQTKWKALKERVTKYKLAKVNSVFWWSADSKFRYLVCCKTFWTGFSKPLWLVSKRFAAAVQLTTFIRFFPTYSIFRNTRGGVGLGRGVQKCFPK